MSTLHVRDLGAGSVVLLLGGSPTPAEHLGRLAQVLSANHRVLLPDLPGYGSSSELPGEDIFPETQAALERELHRRRVDEISIVGLSLGGYRSLALALGGVVRVRRLVILGGFAGFDAATREAFRTFAAAVRASVPLEDVFVARMLSTSFVEQHPDIAASVRKWMKLTTPEWFARELDAAAASEDLRPRLKELSSRLLARVGSLDEASPLAWSQEICHLAPESKLEVVPNAGHLLLLEDEQATISSIASFLLS
ncbi:MAG: 3-oxoadipate enol-lactonase [Myxococcales bacterium]|nr:3-oxoadipate enol-lactonase [Myxococcales bacterium]